MTKRRSRLATMAMALGLVISATLSGPRIGDVAHAASVPPGLPTHFGIGLSAGPNDNGIYGWMPNSGIPWDYAYQYLSAGVNTGNGWETWNTDGQFPLWYAQGAASNHYIPVFTYYDLLQSNGSCGSCSENQKDLSNLNNAGTMASYFQNFRLLMQRLGPGAYGGITGFGGTAIVHVEPDLSAYAQQAVLDNSNCFGYCTAQGNSPAYLQAAVASSGDPDVQVYPNTYQGFNWALLHLRDLYAPNVLLAFHISNWSTGPDISTDSSNTLDATGLGQQAGSFAAASGAASVPTGTRPYDLLFNDVADRDAGYSKYVFNDPSRWWDRTNTVVPNFHRWEAYIGAAGRTAGRSVIVWQIPEGNQYFDTVNNTDGHYQDNRAEYFFGHIGELAQSGIIGLLFGAGNGGSTVHVDGKQDGVTNPPSFCTTDGMGNGQQICNNHTSTVSDDDGGYIRMEAQQYFAGGGYQLGNASTPTLAVEGSDQSLYVNHGTGYTFLGGVLIAAPAVVALPNGTDLYIATSTDHHLWERTDSTGWQPLAGGYCIDNPAATVSGNTLIVACTGGDHGIYYTTATIPTNGLPFITGWTPYWGASNFGPAVAVVNGTPTVFAVGIDGVLYRRSATQTWTPFPSTWCTGHPAAASTGGTSYVACHGGDNALWYASTSGPGWSGFQPLGGGLIDGPAIAGVASGPVFFAEGSDTAVYERSLSAGWQYVGGGVLHGVAATAG